MRIAGRGQVYSVADKGKGSFDAALFMLRLFFKNQRFDRGYSSASSSIPNRLATNSRV